MKIIIAKRESTDKKTRGRARGGRREDAQILTESDQDKIRNEYIGGTAQVDQFGDKVREGRVR